MSKRKYYTNKDWQKALDQAVDRAAKNIKAQHETGIKLSRKAARDWLRRERERLNLEDLEAEEEEEEGL